MRLYSFLPLRAGCSLSSVGQSYAVGRLALGTARGGAVEREVRSTAAGGGQPHVSGYLPQCTKGTKGTTTTTTEPPPLNH